MNNNSVNNNLPLSIPKIMNFDTRCSRGCYKNWTKFGQKVPNYQICECNKSRIEKKNGKIISFNLHKLQSHKIKMP